MGFSHARGFLKSKISDDAMYHFPRGARAARGSFPRKIEEWSGGVDVSRTLVKKPSNMRPVRDCSRWLIR